MLSALCSFLLTKRKITCGLIGIGFGVGVCSCKFGLMVSLQSYKAGGVDYICTFLALHRHHNTDKNIWVYTNQKPWMTKEVRTLIRNKNTAFTVDRSDVVLCSAARIYLAS